MNPKTLTDAIRNAVESATVPPLDATTSRVVEDTIFTTETRQRLQHVIRTSSQLAEAEEACTEEAMRQVREKNLDAAFAAVSLQKQLPRLCPPRRDYVMDPDGTWRRLEP